MGQIIVELKKKKFNKTINKVKTIQPITSVIKSLFNLEVYVNNTANLLTNSLNNNSSNFSNWPNRNNWYNETYNFTNNNFNNLPNDGNNLPNIKTWKFFNGENGKFTKEISKLNSMSLQKMYNSLVELSKKDDFAKELSEVLMKTSWRPNIQINNININKFNKETKELLFFAHTYFFEKIKFIIYTLKTYGIELSPTYLRCIFINKLIIDKFKYTSAQKYEEFIENGKKVGKYYRHYIEIYTQERKRKIMLSRYFTDEDGKILLTRYSKNENGKIYSDPKYPFLYNIDFDSGNITNLSPGQDYRKLVWPPEENNV